uniref:TBCEL n=1 Tax=Macrostomum lignano TaxID=282301 RepID=A0A1I8F6I3_9PLAT
MLESDELAAMPEYAKRLATSFNKKLCASRICTKPNNQFASAGTVEIAYAHNRYLTLLDLSWNQVRADGAICLCDSLAVNQELETLLLANNGLSIQGCKSLAKITSNSLWPKPMPGRQGLTVDQQTISNWQTASELSSLQLLHGRVLRGESKTEEDLQGLNDDPM